MAEVTGQLKDTGIQVVHATAGRVRLRAIGLADKTLGSVAEQLRQQEGVYAVKLNENTGSLVVNFDVASVSLSQLLSGLTDCEIACDSKMLLPSSKSQTSSLSANSFQKVSGKTLERLIPLTSGILVTRALPVSRWLSLPIYIATATVTRQVMQQLLSLVQVRQGEEEEREREEKEEKLLIPDAQSKIELVHATPGRVRFRVPQMVSDLDYAQRLPQLVGSIEEVTEVRLNRSAGSLAIAYQTDTISDVQMRSRLAKLIEDADPNKNGGADKAEENREIDGDSNGYHPVTLETIEPDIEENSNGHASVKVETSDRDIEEDKQDYLVKQSLQLRQAEEAKGQEKKENSLSEQYGESTQTSNLVSTEEEEVKPPSEKNSTTGFWSGFKPSILSYFLALMAVMPIPNLVLMTPS
ncbi:MAG: HMA2 domain-containing protein [Prochloraceae cyanobacterium]